MATLSNALPFTLLVGLFVRAVAAARATSTGLVLVSCAVTLRARRKGKIKVRTVIFGPFHEHIESSQTDGVDLN